MNGYEFTVSCPTCGGDVRHVNGCHQSSWEVCAVIQCARCHHQFSIHTFLRPMANHTRTPA